MGQPPHGIMLAVAGSPALMLGLLLAELSLLDQVAIGKIVNAVVFAMLVLHFAQEELGIDVAIRDLTAVRVEAAAYQMQAGGYS